MRFNPSQKLNEFPCSVVALASATDLSHFNNEEIKEIMNHCKKDGYMSLKCMDKMIKKFYNLKEEREYKTYERPTLEHFLNTNNRNAIVCVVGHFIYVEGSDYFSFFNNDKDKIVKVWYI